MNEDKKEEEIRLIANKFAEALKLLGLDLNDEHLKDTPKRIAKMYKELFCGICEPAEPNFRTFTNPGYNEMIIVQGDFSSTCSHHLLPFIGKFYFAYIPKKKVCGLSKIPRVVEFFARRPQLQERLTQQIIQYLDKKLESRGCMLVIKAKHYCEILRGVKQREDSASTITSAVTGEFFKPDPKKGNPRAEFLSLINLKND